MKQKMSFCKHSFAGVRADELCSNGATLGDNSLYLCGLRLQSHITHLVITRRVLVIHLPNGSPKYHSLCGECRRWITRINRVMTELGSIGYHKQCQYLQVPDSVHNNDLQTLLKMLVFFMFRLNIRHIFLFPASLLLCLTGHAAEKTEFHNKTPLGKDMEVIAFVGQKISFEEKNLPETISVNMPDGTTVERVIPSFDTRYEAKYEVLTWISEEKAQEIIDFEVYDHYGRPALPKIPTPLVLLVNYSGRWVQSKYNNYNLSQTTDGDWGICGKPARHKTAKDQGERYVQPLAFINPVKDHNGNICTSGTRVTDILEYQYETRFLPNKWRTACNLELGLQRNVIAGTGSAPDAGQVGLAHTACVEKLKFEEGMLRD